MFGNFLYYIIALLIYSTYQPANQPDFPVSRCIVFFCGLALLFSVFTWRLFKKIEARIQDMSLRHLDQRFQSVLTRQSIMALFVFAVDIYGLNVGVLLNRFPIVKSVPTLEALIFLTLFISYLSIVWTLAYGPYKKIYGTGLSRRDYVWSNISFSIPILLPWLFLSATADLINILPFEAPKHLLLSTGGQIAYFVFFLLVIAVIGPAMIQRFWGCRPLSFGAARDRIESLCRQAGMRFKNIMIWPLFGGHMITAGVMGLIRQFRYILITPALLQHLDPEEIDAVIAHEIGHIKKYHLLFYLFFFAGYLILVFSSLDLITYVIVYVQAMSGTLDINEPGYATFTSILFSLIMIIIFLVYFRYIFGYFMRNFERQADMFAYRLVGNARPLISTFEKIALTSGQDPERPNWHHFSILERIDSLKKCETDPSWIKRHNLKIKKSITLYIAAIMLLGWTGYRIHYGETGQAINTVLLKTIILKQVKNDPHNPDLYQVLGDIYYSEKDYEKTVTAYRHALLLNPHHVRALNNLAWLYATCEDKRYRRPQKALELAKQAATLSAEPHIIDTLAEAYYVNGDFQAAIETEKRALATAETGKLYYQRQMDKFKAALAHSMPET